MDRKGKDKIKDILKGRVSSQDAYRYLISMKDDQKSALPEEELNDLREAIKIKSANAKQPEPVVSENEKAEIWTTIIKDAEQPALAHHKVVWLSMQKLQGVVDFLKSATHLHAFRYGAITALLVLLAILPIAVNRHMAKNQSGMEVKGDSVGPSASLQFAIIDSHHELSRPNRPLTQSDTIVFRVNAHSDGYCSIYIIHEDQIESVIDNKRLSQGTHDLKQGYAFEGNHGLNTVVMLFSAAPVKISENEKEKIILYSSRNDIDSTIMGGSPVKFVYTQIEIQ